MATVTKAANAHAVLTTGWTNPGNAYATTGDNVYATAVPAKNATVSGAFGFPAFTTSDIPDDSLIESVDITVEWGMTAAVTGGLLGCYGYDVTDGEQLGPDITKTTTAEAQTTIHCEGVALSELRTANRIQARVRCSKGSTTNAMTGNLDFVSLTVTYSATPGSGAIPVKASKLTGTTTSASGPISSTAGNALFVGAAGYTANLSGVISVSDTGGNTYTVDSQGDSSASSLRSRVGIASAPNVAGGTATLTVSCTNAAGVWAQILEMSGMATSSMLDSSAPVIAIGSSATGTSNSETNTQADAVFLGMVGSESSSSTALVDPAAGWFDQVGDTWMGQRNGATEAVSGFAFQIVASSAARTASWALTSANWGVLVAAYKVSTGPAPVALSGNAKTQAIASTQPNLSFAASGEVAAGGAVAALAIALAQSSVVSARASTSGTLDVGVGPVALTGDVVAGGSAATEPSIRLAGASAPLAIATTAPRLAVAGSIASQASVASAPRLSLPGAVVAAATSSVTPAIAVAGSATSAAVSATVPALALPGISSAQASANSTLDVAAPGGVDLSGDLVGGGSTTAAASLGLSAAVGMPALAAAALRLAVAGGALPSAVSAAALAVGLPGASAAHAAATGAPSLALASVTVTQGASSGTLSVATGAVALAGSAGGQAVGSADLAALLAGAGGGVASSSGAVVLAHALPASTAAAGASVSATLTQAAALSGAIAPQATAAAGVRLAFVAAVGAQSSTSGSPTLRLVVVLVGQAVTSGAVVRAYLLVGEVSTAGQATGTFAIITWAFSSATGGQASASLVLFITPAVVAGIATIVPLIVVGDARGTAVPIPGTAVLVDGTDLRVGIANVSAAMQPGNGLAIFSAVVWGGSFGDGTFGSGYFGGTPVLTSAPPRGVAEVS